MDILRSIHKEIKQERAREQAKRQSDAENLRQVALQNQREQERLKEEAGQQREQRRQVVATWLHSECGLHQSDAADESRAMASAGFDTIEMLELLVKRTLALPPQEQAKRPVNKNLKILEELARAQPM